MADTLDIRERPQARRIDMIAGWRQWADAGSVSSALPEYLIERTGARPSGTLRPDGFYLFQIPGTHDLVRPVVRVVDGYPEALDVPRNELNYTGDDDHGVVIFLGDEPHIDVERYVAALLEAARTLGVRRIVGLGGVYGELPYDKERMVSANYSLPEMKEEMAGLAVELSDYRGGASIGSYLCRRAGEQGMEYVGLYAFVPTYSFASLSETGNMIRIETDHMAWLAVMRRINYMLKTRFDLDALVRRGQHLLRSMEEKIAELEEEAPQLGVREYLAHISEAFTEVPFNPLGDVWEEELRRLFDDSEAGPES